MSNPTPPEKDPKKVWEDSWRPEDKAMESAEDEQLPVESQTATKEDEKVLKGGGLLKEEDGDLKDER